MAYILINTEEGKEEKVASLLSLLPQVRNVNISKGEYNIIAEVEVKDEFDLQNFLVKNVRSMPYVFNTSTLF